MDSETLKPLAEAVSLAVDATGVAVIVAGIVRAAWRALRGAHDTGVGTYRRLRQDVGRGILLGLELMVAGDIIRTVAVEPTLESLAVLGGIVLIRTFLSISLEVELEGRWPWQRAREAPARDQASPAGASAASGSSR